MAESIRVMLVADAVGGVWDHALSLASGLIQFAGAEVSLVAVGPAPDAGRLAAAAALGLECHVLDGRLEWMEGGGGDWLETWRRALAGLAIEWRADVLHVNQLGLAAVGKDERLAARPDRPAVVLGVHSDVTTWWRWVKDEGGAGARSRRHPRPVSPVANRAEARPGPGGRQSTLPEFLFWQRDLAREAMHVADVVVCPSAFLAEELVAGYGLARRPVVIHNAALPPASDGITGPGDERVRGLGAVVGRAWDEAKNLAIVAQALPACRTPWRVEVAGDVAEPGRVGMPAPPAAPGLTYLGFLDKGRLGKLFERASVCLAPSKYEPFGLAPAEAALAGCAVVANDLPSYHEVWGDSACYFRRNDPAALAAVLDRLYENPAAVSRLARAAGERVRARYTLRRMVEGYLDVYGELRKRRQWSRRGYNPTGRAGEVSSAAAPLRGQFCWGS